MFFDVEVFQQFVLVCMITWKYKSVYWCDASHVVTGIPRGIIASSGLRVS